MSGGDQVLLQYGQKGVNIVIDNTQTVIAISVLERSLGKVDGVRVGDPYSAVMERWGRSVASGRGMALYDRGTWAAGITTENGVVSAVEITVRSMWDSLKR